MTSFLFWVTARPELKGDKLRDLKIKAGQDICLSVSFEGAPPPTITWKLNGQQVTPSERVSIKEGEESTELKVKMADRSHSGTYELTLSNESGDCKTSCEVNVQGK